MFTKQEWEDLKARTAEQYKSALRYRTRLPLSNFPTTTVEDLAELERPTVVKTNRMTMDYYGRATRSSLVLPVERLYTKARALGRTEQHVLDLKARGFPESLLRKVAGGEQNLLSILAKEKKDE